MVMEMSKTYQYRKVMKPLLERKRRARINKCLDHLKDLMVECLQQDGEHVTRLEKADILELTVEHMRKLKQRGSLSLGTPPAALQLESFRSGYVHAADQISQVLLQQRQPAEIGQKVIAFLSTRLMELQSQIMPPVAVSAVPTAPAFQFVPSNVLSNAAFDGGHRSNVLRHAAETPSFSHDLSDCSSVDSDCKSKFYKSTHDDDDDEEDVEISVTNEDPQPSTSSIVQPVTKAEPMWRPW